MLRSIVPWFYETFCNLSVCQKFFAGIFEEFSSNFQNALDYSVLSNAVTVAECLTSTVDAQQCRFDRNCRFGAQQRKCFCCNFGRKSSNISPTAASAERIGDQGHLGTESNVKRNQPFAERHNSNFDGTIEHFILDQQNSCRTNERNESNIDNLFI